MRQAEDVSVSSEAPGDGEAGGGVGGVAEGVSQH